MDISTEALDNLVTKLPKVMPDTIDRVIKRLKPGSDYYLDKIKRLSTTNNYLHRYIDAYSRKTTYPDETIRTALLSYSLLEAAAGEMLITKQATDCVEEEKLFRTEQEFVSSILYRMEGYNPDYFKALESYIHISKGRAMNWATAAFMYRIFEKQAELNKLKIN